MSDFYLYGKKLETTNIFQITGVSSGQFLTRLNCVPDIIYTVRFLDGREIPLHESNFKMCRKLSDGEKLELL